MHVVEREVRVVEVDLVAEIHVAHPRVSWKLALERRRHLGLLAAVALPEVGTGAIRLRGDDHLIPVPERNIDRIHDRAAVLRPWKLAASGCRIVDRRLRLGRDTPELPLER